MARGMAAGEQIVSQAATNEFRAGHDRTFGMDRKPQRGRWVWDPERKCLVDAASYRAPEKAKDAPIIADRLHEGTTFEIDGKRHDIGSRRKRRDFMRAVGVEDATDCSPRWLVEQAQEKERKADRVQESAFKRAAEKLYLEGKLRG